MKELGLSDENVPAFINVITLELEPAMFLEMLAKLGPRITK